MQNILLRSLISVFVVSLNSLKDSQNSLDSLAVILDSLGVLSAAFAERSHRNLVKHTIQVTEY